MLSDASYKYRKQFYLKSVTNYFSSSINFLIDMTKCPCYTLCAILVLYFCIYLEIWLNFILIFITKYSIYIYFKYNIWNTNIFKNN